MGEFISVEDSETKGQGKENEIYKIKEEVKAKDKIIANLNVQIE